MSAVIDFLEDVANVVIEAVEDLVEAAWDAIVEPILEQVFAIFGITDETVVTVQRVSSPIYAVNTTDVVEAGITRAILTKIKTDTSFFPNYMQEIYRTKGQVRAYFRYADLGIYYAGLPDMTIKGMSVDFADVQQALDEVFGSTHTVIAVTSHFPNKNEWFRYALQDSPEFYKPWLNSLTHTDIYGVTWDDWQLGVITYNSGPDNYTINISRDAAAAEFWIDGPGQVTEGDTATFVIKSNRVVPTGESVDINLTYSGTAVDPTDYAEVAQVTMLADTDEITVDIVTAESVNANTNFTITLDSIDNNNAAFEHVVISPMDSISCTITDDDALILTMNDVAVDEANTTITIPVKLEQAAPSGAFTIDYDFTDLGSIVGGTDYDNTTGTLNFAGTLGETQDITVDIYADIVDDDREQFEVFLTNSSDVDSIDISAVSTVTIFDGTDDPTPGTVPLPDTITEPAFVAADSIIVQYSDDSEPLGQYHFWIRAHSDPTYDLLPQNVTIDQLEMLPMAILRKEKTMADTLYGTGSNEYITTKNLLARIGFGIQEFMDAIEGNPGIADIDDAYLNFSLAPKDSHKLVAKLLYLQWFEIIVTQGLQSNVDEHVASILEGDIQNAIVWKSHTYRFDNVGVVTAEGDYITTITNTNLKLQFQRTATNYDELELTNMNGMTGIEYDGYHEVALCQLGDDEFTIPISWDSFNQLEAEEMMELFQYIARLDMNAINITELEWYETQDFFDFFEFAMIAFTVIVTVYSLGTATNVALSAYAMVQAYVVSYAIGELIIFIAEATGNDILAAIIGVVAAVALTKPSLLSTDQLMQADTLLDLSTDFAENIALLDNIEAQELAEEIQELNAEAQEKIDAEKANREDAEAVAVDAQFLAGIQGVDTNYFPAISGQYNFDQLYNYDSLVGKYHDTQLQVGVR